MVPRSFSTILLTARSARLRHRADVAVSGSAPTTFSGDFNSAFTYSPMGPVEPTGPHLDGEVIGILRHDDEGRLAEEWTQTDYRIFLTKLA